MARDEDAPPSGRKRFFKLAGLTAGMAGRYAGHAVANRFRSEEERKIARKQLQQKAGEDLAETLGELKGAVMKIGQYVSQTAEFLPRDIAEPLKALQKQAPPMSFAAVQRQLAAGLEAGWEQHIAELDPKSYAAASIGQVHRARLTDGREVVIKVQYPGVAESCDSDLRQLRRALRAGRLLNVSREALDAMFEEIRVRLHEELDYAHEARNIELFAEFFRDDAKIIIPRCVPELSSASVLTMELQPGDELDHASEHYPQDLRNELSERLFHFMCRSLFELRNVHADPNPGNFAYRSDGSLVVYDFGCIKPVSEDILRAYRQAVTGGLAEDWASVDAALIELGARIADSAPVDDTFYAEWRPIVMKPFILDEPFDFAASRIHRAVMAKSADMLQYMHQFQPPAKTIYLDRMVGGHYWTLVKLGGRLQLGPALQTYLN